MVNGQCCFSVRKTLAGIEFSGSSFIATNTTFIALDELFTFLQSAIIRDEDFLLDENRARNASELREILEFLTQHRSDKRPRSHHLQAVLGENGLGGNLTCFEIANGNGLPTASICRRVHPPAILFRRSQGDSAGCLFEQLAAPFPERAAR
jgi:hypothetical protein